MERNGIVDFRTHAALAQVFAQSIASSVAGANNKLVKDVALRRLLQKAFRALRLTQCRRTLIRIAVPCAVERSSVVKMPQLNPQHRGLKSIEPTVNADNLVMVLLFFAMQAQHAQALRMFDVIGRQHSAIAGSAEVL